MIYKYNIGENIRTDKIDVTIIDRKIESYIDDKNHTIRKKNYRILCNKCGYKYYKQENRVEYNCPCCINKVVVKGINDVATTHPEHTKYFVDIEDAYSHTYGSSKYVWCICPECNTKKYMQVSQLIRQGICCPMCSDGVSYPEKFVANMFIQLDIDYIRQYSKKDALWVGDKFYDFYLPKYNTIVEVHGMQHYKQSFSQVSYETQVKIDKEKRDNAIKNNISYYIEIDARYSEMLHIKDSILNSELSSIINLENVKWDICNEMACTSFVKIVCDFWENNKEKFTTNDIAKHFNMDRCTIVSYLKKGTINEWCEYDARESLLKTLKNNAPKINYDIVKDVCNNWNDGLGVLELSQKYNFSTPTIVKYLKYGNENNLCIYSETESRKRSNKQLANKSKQVNVYKDGKFILSEINARILSDTSLEKLGVKLGRANIAAVCTRDRNHHHGFVFRYDEDDEFKNSN